jgi:DNA-binding SARP family transcriptional activator/tetratricopeptide (TPR) repeat protein
VLTPGAPGASVGPGFQMEFRILGPFEVVDAGRAVGLGGRKKRAALAILVLHHDQVVSSDRLIEELWGERAPPTALQTVRVHVSQIRKTLGSELVRTLPAGYMLELEPHQLDSRRFERLVGEGTEAIAAGEAPTAAALLHEALDLWRGPALADFVYEPFAQGEIARLDELRLAALEARIDADLAVGRHVELVGELEGLIAGHPLRERLRAQLMLALYRAGRQSESLAAYSDARRTFVEEVGLEPSLELRSLERAILEQEPSLGVAPLSARVPVAPSVRKTVTVVHVALGAVGGDAADPEALAPRLAGPVEKSLAVVGRHEGSVTAQQGNAVTATFGLPSLHEDDALRAVRAAVDLRELFAGDPELGPRIGIATGEVVASESATLLGTVAGSALGLAHVGARAEIVLDEPTRRLVANAVDVAPSPVAGAFRLRALLPGAPPFARRLEAPLVGRRAELAELLGAFEHTLADSEPALLTVVGPPGIGKSRLAGELLEEVADRGTALVGRCLSYGQGITLWPLREMVREAAGGETREALAGLLDGESDGPVVADAIAAAFGFTGDAQPAEETVWAFRRLFETLARSRPHVLVVEDAHWAEPALLDLLEYVTRATRGVALLILCLARPELRETRAAGEATAVELGPLSPGETEALIDNLPLGASLTPEVRRRVVDVAEGNALFAEQLVALLAADGGTEVAPIAPTIHAILAARLDRLGPAERAVVERAAVVGREFTLEAVAELLPTPAASSASRHLRALTHKRLVDPDRAVLPGETGYRFQHGLIHDAAYRRLPKALRAELHERLADWLERRAGTRIAELEEIVGYHLEQACRYRLELDADQDSVRELAARAADRLAAAGRRAFQRTDFVAANSLLSRAVELLPGDDPTSVELLNMLGSALGPIGELERQRRVLDQAVQRATALGDPTREWQARLELAFSNSRGGTPGLIDAERALSVFERANDSLGAARASAMIAHALVDIGRAGEALTAAEQALAYARESGVNREYVRAQWSVTGALLAGPTPVPSAIARCEELLENAPESLVGTVGATWVLSVLRAMACEFAVARELVERTVRFLEAIAHPRPLITMAYAEGLIEMLAGEPARAAQAYRRGIEIARAIGDADSADMHAVRLAEALCLIGRGEEAAEGIQAIPSPPESGSLSSSARWRLARARVLALQGELAEAESQVLDATALVASTDLLNLRGDVMLVLADVLEAEARSAESAAALGEAVRLYERKGNVAAVALAHSQLQAKQSA